MKAPTKLKDFTLFSLPSSEKFSLIEKQFLDIELQSGNPATYNFSHSNRNADKNRYLNVKANDETIFPPVTPSSASAAGSYINGNWIQNSHLPLKTQKQNDNSDGSFSVAPHFVACQAPIPPALYDFFNTLYENEIQFVIMLTALAEGGFAKADRYWPSSGLKEFKLREWTKNNPGKSTLEFNQGANGEPLSKEGVRQALGLSKSSSLPADLQEEVHFTDPSLSSLGEVHETLGVLAAKVGPFVIWPDPIHHPYREDESLKLVERTFFIQKMDKGSREGKASKIVKVKQLQYTGWPDHGVPVNTKSFDAILNAIQHYREEVVEGEGKDPTTAAPILVHCSAGIGRTGTLIGVYTALELLRHLYTPSTTNEWEKGDKEKNTTQSVFFTNDTLKKIVLAMRERRFGMVQRLEQYCFMYVMVFKAIAHYESIDTDESFKNALSEFTEYVNKNGDAAQLRILEAVQQNADPAPTVTPEIKSKVVESKGTKGFCR